MNSTVLRCYVVLDLAVVGPRCPVELTQAVLRGGASAIQLRGKDRPLRELAHLATALLPLVRAHNVPLIINDYVDLARAIDADGVHLGAHDLPPALARRCLPQGIIGYSPADCADLLSSLGADYLGVGPIYATSTKADAGQPIGTQGLQTLRAATELPVVAIGGITPTNIAEVLRSGVDGLAICSSVLCAADPHTAMCSIVSTVNTYFD